MDEYKVNKQPSLLAELIRLNLIYSLDEIKAAIRELSLEEVDEWGHETIPNPLEKQIQWP